MNISITTTAKTDEEGLHVITGYKGIVEGFLGASYTTFEPISYTTQVVAGTNYLVKVKVGDNKYVHIKIWKRLPHEGETTELTEASGNKTEDSQL